MHSGVRWWRALALLVVSSLVPVLAGDKAALMSHPIAPVAIDLEIGLITVEGAAFTGDSLDQETCTEFHLDCDQLEEDAVCDADASGDCHCANLIPGPGLYCRVG